MAKRLLKKLKHPEFTSCLECAYRQWELPLSIGSKLKCGEGIAVNFVFGEGGEFLVKCLKFRSKL